jgi:hypothetical protein
MKNKNPKVINTIGTELIFENNYHLKLETVYGWYDHGELYYDSFFTVKQSFYVDSPILEQWDNISFLFQFIDELKREEGLVGFLERNDIKFEIMPFINQKSDFLEFVNMHQETRRITFEYENTKSNS